MFSRHQNFAIKFLKFSRQQFFLQELKYFNSFEGLLEDPNVFKTFIERKNEKQNVKASNSFNKTLSVFSHSDKLKIDASVLILLFSLPFSNSMETEPWVLFTKRSSKLRSHPGEISFPGGKTEENETFEQAALREAHEEIALSIDKVDVWGNLKPIFTSSKISVIGVVGILNDINHLNALKPSCSEVDTIFVAPLNELTRSVKYTIFRQIRNDNIINFKLPIFYTKNYRIICSNNNSYINVKGFYRIWGLTAINLHETIRSILREEDMKKLENIN